MRLMRHPKTAAPEGLCYGRTDPGLPSGWESPVDAASRELDAIATVVSSPAPRCLHAAERIAAALGRPLDVDGDLVELNFGAWEGSLWTDIDRAELDVWATDPIARRPPGGETFRELIDRVERALDKAAENTLLVTHAGPIRAVWMQRGGLTFNEAFSTMVPFARPVGSRPPTR